MKQAADSALLTDLYQLTMLQAYHDECLDGSAVFELFVRALPAQRNFLLLAGIEQALAFLEQLRFDPGELDWLRATGRFRTDFLDWLSELRFRGEVHAMREGTVFFANEPVLRVEVPIAQAQLVESRLLNLIHYATLVASKAARYRLAAPDSLLVDFGLRRAHGAEAGLVAARSSYLAGFAGSATVLAGQYYGIPVFGTMAHSYVEVHELEVPALDAVYKLQSYAGKPRRKRSEGKATWPGAKQVWRWSGPDGRLERDLVALADEATPAGGLALLQPVMRAQAYPVAISDPLRQLATSLDRQPH